MKSPLEVPEFDIKSGLQNCVKTRSQNYAIFEQQYIHEIVLRITMLCQKCKINRQFDVSIKFFKNCHPDNSEMELHHMMKRFPFRVNSGISFLSEFSETTVPSETWRH